jgi:hypothetical protein
VSNPTIKPKNLCLFCGVSLTKSNSSNEHIFPAWLLDHLDIRKLEISPTYYEAEEDADLSKPFDPSYVKVKGRKHTLNNLLEGRVCSECNNGWMSELEATVKPILIELLAKRIEFTALSSEQKFILSRWAFKIAILINASGDFPVDFIAEHFSNLRNDSTYLPDGLCVLGRRSTQPGFEFVQSKFWWTNELGSKEETKLNYNETTPTSFKVSYLMGDLSFGVFYWPDLNWRVVGVPNWHELLWYWHYEGCSMPNPPTCESDDPLMELYWFNQSVGVAKDNVDRSKSGKLTHRVDGSKIGQNDSCLCGSGRKFKKCHGKL